jgi:hypothetical protein
VTHVCQSQQAERGTLVLLGTGKSEGGEDSERTVDIITLAHETLSIIESIIG